MIYRFLKKRFRKIRSHLLILLRRFKLLKYYYRIFPKHQKVNIGGGKFNSVGWLVLDVSSDHYQYKNIDVDFNLETFEPLPFKDNSVRYFYSISTLEHISPEYIQHIFNEIYRCLQPGGAVRINVPDFDFYYDAFGRGDEKYFNFSTKADNLGGKFLHMFASAVSLDYSYQEVKLNYDKMTKTEFADYYIKKAAEKRQKVTDAVSHCMWFNIDKLTSLLTAAGFAEINNCKFGQSEFMDLAVAEKMHNCPDEKTCVIVEAVK